VKRSHTYLLGVIGAVVIIGGIFSIYFSNTSVGILSGKNNGGKGYAPPRITFQGLTSDGSSFQGNPAAPVTLVEFGDFQCEFCARFVKDTEPQIYQNYIATGKINMVFKHLVHYGSNSDLAAAGSQCANDQGKFWDYYHILYTNQDSFMLSQDSEKALKNLASKIEGFDMQKFDSCLAGDT